MMKPHQPKLRHRIHCAFLAWYDQHKAQLPFPLLYAGRKDDCLRLAIPSLHSAFVITLTWELVIAIEWQNHCWDLLHCFEASPRRCAGGHSCYLCDEQAQKIFASREALWQDHLFDPFVVWLNDVLLPAKWLGLYGETKSSTWAQLLEEPDPQATHVLPVWPDKP